MTDKIELFNNDGESRGFYSIKNKLNNLTGKEWTYWSKSVITNKYKLNFQHKLRSKHGGQKPPDLCADIIKVFTKEGDTVLDPFAGVGGSLIGATISKRKGLGIELNNQWHDIYKEVCDLEKIKKEEFIVGDSNIEIEKLYKKGKKIDFILTDVPYWNMDKLDKSKGKYKKVGENQQDKKISKLRAFNEKEQTKEEWLLEMKNILKKSKKLLKENGYIAVFIGDMYRNGEYHNLSGDLFNVLTKIGFTPKANLIRYDVSKSLHIYGYLYQFIPSLIHQNIIIFRNEK